MAHIMQVRYIKCGKLIRKSAESSVQISMVNGRRNQSKITEKLELREFAAKNGINRPELNELNN